MASMKRIILFLAVNALVIVTISLILNILNVQPYITPYGLNYESLIAFCCIWGVGGAFISLALSRKIAKWTMGVKVVEPNSPDPQMRELLNMVHELSKAAHLPKMPEVGVYNSPEVNAFATGPSKSRSLVAVSTGLLSSMRPNEIKGVIGHEVAHIANGDMVTMTLVQGVINAFVMFLARVIAFALTMNREENNEQKQGASTSFFIVQFVLEMVFMILGSIVVAWFSRHREYRADSGGARLAGRENMVQALEGLKRTFQQEDPTPHTMLRSFKISSSKGSLMKLFSTHPPLEERILKLKQAIG